MKRQAAFVTALSFLTFMMSGCASDVSTFSADTSKEDKLSIVAVNFPQYDFVRQIAGDNVDLKLLIQPGTEVHDYDPTPQDLIAVQDCDLFIYVGGESDTWVEDILQSSSKPSENILVMMDCVDKYNEETQEGMTEEHDEEHDGEEHGEGESEYDEHIWTSPKNAIKITNAICEKLSALDGKNAKTYEKNRLDYVRKLSTLDNRFSEITQNASNKTLIFGDRFPFLYFVREYGLDYYAAFPGCSHESEPTASTLSFLIDKAKTDKTPVIFYIEFSNGKTADIICEETGAKKLLFHSCHNVTGEQFDSGITYLQLMEQNAENLEEALK